MSPLEPRGGDRLLLGLEGLRLAVSRWRSPAPVPAPAAVRRDRERPRILIVTPYYLHPPRHGAAVRLTELLKRIRADCEIHLLVCIGGSDDVEQRRFLEPLCSAVHFHQVGAAPVPGEPELLPSRIRPFASWSLVQRVVSLAFAHEVDAIQFDNSELAALVGLPGAARQILVELDLTFRSVARSRRWSGGTGGETRSRWEELAWLRIERQALGGADQVHCMSRVDRDVLARLAPRDAERLRVIPNGATTSAPPAGSGPGRDVLFVGSFPHLPNQQALRFLIEAIWPRIHEALPDRRLLVAGAAPPDWVRALDARDGVEVIGEVADLGPLYARAAVSVVPIRSGSGTRLKILDALASGVSVVSTSLGVEGLDRLRPGEDLLVADGARAFAAAVIGLLLDPERAERLARTGRERVVEAYSWARIAPDLMRAYREIPPAFAPRERRLDETEDGETGPAGEPASGADAPAITIVVDASEEGRAVGGLLESFSDQVEQRFEVVVLLPPGGASDPVPATLAGRVRYFERAELRYGVGRLVRFALRHARGRFLVFLDGRCRVDDRDWLGHLTWPLFQPAPPGAVEGSTRGPGGGEVAGPRLAFEASGQGFEGRHLSFRHSALSRRLLASLPPAGDDGFPSLGWSLQLTAVGGWVLHETKARVSLPDGSRTGARERSIPASSAGSLAATVVVCSRNRADDLQGVLESLFEQSAEFEWEILVVDNGSTDDSAERLDDLRRRAPVSLRVAREPAPGLSASRNLALRLARGEWVAYLDDDARPQPGWLAAFGRALGGGGAVAAGGPVDPWHSGVLPYWFRTEYLLYLAIWDRGPMAHALPPTDLPRGANMAVRTESARRAGGFRRELGRAGRSLRSCEETELFRRLLEAGGQVHYSPEARVWHRVRAERLSQVWMRERYAQQGFSEAIVDWLEGGLAGLRRGWARHRERLIPPRGPLGAIDASFRAAAFAAYRRGAFYAVTAVSRAHEGTPGVRASTP